MIQDLFPQIKEILLSYEYKKDIYVTKVLFF